ILLEVTANLLHPSLLLILPISHHLLLLLPLLLHFFTKVWLLHPLLFLRGWKKMKREKRRKLGGKFSALNSPNRLCNLISTSSLLACESPFVGVLTGLAL